MWNMASFSLFFRYYCGKWFNKLAELIPLPHFHGSSIWYSEGFNIFVVLFPSGFIRFLLTLRFTVSPFPELLDSAIQSTNCFPKLFPKSVVIFFCLRSNLSHVPWTSFVLSYNVIASIYQITLHVWISGNENRKRQFFFGPGSIWLIQYLLIFNFSDTSKGPIKNWIIIRLLLLLLILIQPLYGPRV